MRGIEVALVSAGKLKFKYEKPRQTKMGGYVCLGGKVYLWSLAYLGSEFYKEQLSNHSRVA